MLVWLLTTGTGDDGDEWTVIAIYSTEQKAIDAQKLYQTSIERPDGSTYSMVANTEEWEVQ